MSRPQWFKNKDYKREMDRTQIGDGSFVQVLRLEDSELLLIREWPNGDTDRIRISVDKGGSYSYVVADRDRFGSAKPFIGDPDWHPPYVHSNTIPGTSPSSIDTYDFRTGRDYAGGRPDLEKEYRNLGLQLISRAEENNFHERPKPTAEGDVDRFRFTGNRPGVPEGAGQSVYREDLTKVKDWDYGR